MRSLLLAAERPPACARTGFGCRRLSHPARCIRCGREMCWLLHTSKTPTAYTDNDRLQIGLERPSVEKYWQIRRSPTHQPKVLTNVAAPQVGDLLPSTHRGLPHCRSGSGQSLRADHLFSSTNPP